MPRLDADRVAVWRDLHALSAELVRTVDREIRAEWDLPLGWFEVLAGLQRAGGWARPHELADDLRLVPSSLSRRLDHLEAEGWVERHLSDDDADRRAVVVELTRRGRQLWREMNLTFRRAVQQHFAGLLSDEQVAALREVLDLVGDRSACYDEEAAR